MFELKNLIIAIVILFSSLLVLFISTGILFQEDSLEELEKEKYTNEIFCGTENPEYSDLANDGRKIFNMNCAACHRLDNKMTGPALRNIVQTREIPYPNYYNDFIRKEDSLINARNPFTIAVNEEYEYEFSHQFDLSESELINLFKYLK